MTLKLGLVSILLFFCGAIFLNGCSCRKDDPVSKTQFEKIQKPKEESSQEEQKTSEQSASSTTTEKKENNSNSDADGTGADGTNSATGGSGADGTNSTAGGTGADGTNSATGGSGADGTNSTAGGTGADGTNSATGGSGADGTNSATGGSGADGADGTGVSDNRQTGVGGSIVSSGTKGYFQKDLESGTTLLTEAQKLAKNGNYSKAYVQAARARQTVSAHQAIGDCSELVHQCDKVMAECAKHLQKNKSTDNDKKLLVQ